MVDVHRKRGESFEAMWRRFNRRFQLSGTKKQAKKIRFHEVAKSKSKVKKSALRKLELQRQYDKLEKQGKTPEVKKMRR